MPLASSFAVLFSLLLHIECKVPEPEFSVPSPLLLSASSSSAGCHPSLLGRPSTYVGLSTSCAVPLPMLSLSTSCAGLFMSCIEYSPFLYFTHFLCWTLPPSVLDCPLAVLYPFFVLRIPPLPVLEYLLPVLGVSPYFSANW